MDKRTTVVAILLTLLAVEAWANPAATAEKETADAWADLGNWTRAVVHYQKAVTLDPKLTQARLRLANGLYRLGKSKEALVELKRLGPEAERSPAVAAAAAVIWLEAKKPNQACTLFGQALRADAEHERSLFGMGQCNHALYEDDHQDQHRSLAMDHYQAYLQHFPRGPYSFPARESLQQLKLGSAGARLAEAKTALANGKFRLAEQVLQKVIASSPQLEEAHYLHGLVLASPVMDRIDEAEQAFSRAPKTALARLQLGLLAYEDDRPYDARDQLEEAVKLDPNLPEPYFHLGLIYMELVGDRDAKKLDYPGRARRAFEKVILLAPRTDLANRASSKLQVLTGKVTFLAESEVIDTASEVALGRKLTEQIEKNFGLVQDEKLQMRLNAILRKVTAHSERLPGALPYRIKVLRVDGVNALSFTGGTIYLYQGLLDFVRLEMDDSDQALAAIIGHEVVHVDRRHGLGMLDLVGGAQGLMQGRSMNVRSLNTLMKGLTRRHEYEADQIGALYAYRAGFDPAAAYRFHRKMIATGHEVPEALDHPTHLDRSGRLKEYLLGLRAKARHFDRGVSSLARDDYEEAIRQFEIFLGVFPTNLAARNNLGVAMHRQAMVKRIGEHPYRLSTDIDPQKQIKRVGPLRGAFSPDRAAMIEAAELFRGIVAEHPSYRAAQTNFGACLLALGELEEASRVFARLVAGGADDPASANNLAVARLLAGHGDAAQTMLENIVKASPSFPEAHFNLARLHQDAGRSAQARKQYQSYLALDADSGWAARAREQIDSLQ